MRWIWSWIDKSLGKFAIKYIFLSITISLLFYVIILELIYHTTKLRQLMNVQIHMSIIIIAILIIFLFIGVQYFLINVKKCFKDLAGVEKFKDYYNDMYLKFEMKLTRSMGFYLILILAIFSYMYPFDIRELLSMYYLLNPSGAICLTVDCLQSLSINIILWFATLFIIYMITTILWIIVNMTWALDRMQDDSDRYDLRIDLFSSDRTGGLKQIKTMILYISIFQFITISLVILQFFVPTGVISFESAYFAVLFLITIFFFLKGLNTINGIIENTRKYVVSNINQLCEQQNQRAFGIILNTNYKNSDEELDQLLKSIEWLQSERDKAMSASRGTYDFITTFTFVSASLLPLITTVSPYILALTLNPYKRELVNQSIEFMANYTNITMRVFG